MGVGYGGALLASSVVARNEKGRHHVWGAGRNRVTDVQDVNRFGDCQRGKENQQGRNRFHKPDSAWSRIRMGDVV